MIILIDADSLAVTILSYRYVASLVMLLVISSFHLILLIRLLEKLQYTYNSFNSGYLA